MTGWVNKSNAPRPFKSTLLQCCIGPLASGKGFCLFDEEDFDALSGLSLAYYLGYATASMHVNGRWRPVRVHRLVAERMGIPLVSGFVIDHINGDKLDNRRSNLRSVTHGQNNQNVVVPQRADKSIPRGVCKLSRTTIPWLAYLKVDGKRKLFKRFATMEEAIAAREEAERQWFTHRRVK